MPGPIKKPGMEPSQGDGPATKTRRSTTRLEDTQPAQRAYKTNGGNSLNSTKSWKDLANPEKVQKILDIIFKCFAFPVCMMSFLTSVGTFILTNIFKRENPFLDKAAEITNRAAYFINGIYGGLENAFSKNTVGAVGYSLVSLSAVIGSKENVYLLKGPGSAFDQLPSMLEDTAFNPEIVKRYGYDPNDPKSIKEFNNYKSFRDNLGKTWYSTIVVVKDIFRDLRAKIPKYGFFKAIKDIFITDKRAAEKNLLVSSVGILAGVGVALGLGFMRLGSSIRDIFGFYADLALVRKGFSFVKKGMATGVGNLKYGICGMFYTMGSVMDFVYRWTKLDKLELAAVGMDNAGFLLMTWANAEDNKATRKNKNGNGQVASGEVPKRTQPPLRPSLAPALP